ncbi:hypothetical protein ACOSP7_005103 [Xanthoceras sorbifolium]
MNENLERLQMLEAKNKVMRVENKELKTKVKLLRMSTTLPPGFGNVHYEINTNPTSAPGQTTPITLASSAQHPIYKLRSAAVVQNLVATIGNPTSGPTAVDPSVQSPIMSTVTPVAPDAIQPAPVPLPIHVTNPGVDS